MLMIWLKILNNILRYNKLFREIIVLIYYYYCKTIMFIIYFVSVTEAIHISPMFTEYNIIIFKIYVFTI